MNELSKFRGPAAFRVDPSEGPSWLTFRCEEDLRESGVITEGDKVVALSEPMAMRERAEPEIYGPYTPVMVGAGVWVSIADELPPHLEGRKVWVTTSPTAPPALVVAPDGLHPATADLVTRFATALAEKLHKAEQKYGRSTDWMKNDWYNDCLQALWEHIEKGDPRDVAAYCAFMWHHGWVTTDYDRNVQSACRAAMLNQAQPAPAVPPVQVPEWTNEQCLEFLSIAFRHAEIKGDLELDDLRLGVKMANAMTTGKEG